MKTASNNSSKNTTTNKGLQAADEGDKQQTSVSSDKGKQAWLQKFFIDQLKDIYYAEKTLLKGLEEMKSAVSTEELEDAFETHRRQTERHVKRLEQVFRLIHQEPEAKTCPAMDGLLKEAREIIGETEAGSYTRDAALIIAAQKVEHYEIATYGGLVQLAVTMDMRRAADILDKTLQEEEDTDRLLTNIAESHINLEAEHEGGYSWAQQEDTVTASR